VTKKSNPKSVKFGGGAEYERVSRDGERASLKEMRSCFLQTVCDLVPEVTDELEKEVLPLYLQIHSLCCVQAISESSILSRSYRANNRPISWNSIEDQLNKKVGGPWSVDKDGKITAFGQKMMDWSYSHNLDAFWCRQSAYETLDLWCYEEDSRKSRFWYWEYGREIDLKFLRILSPKFVFEYTTLYPQSGLRGEVEEKIREDFEKKLKSFLDGCESAAEFQGLKATPVKLDLIHFDWLVLRQVRKPPMTCKQIFERYQDQVKFEGLRHVTTVRAVEKAVKELADELGLTPRYAGRGRKPKAPTNQR
jgi:hypothetical protein